MAIITTQAARTPGDDVATMPGKAVREHGRRVVMQSPPYGRVAGGTGLNGHAVQAPVRMRRVGRLPARVGHVHVAGTQRSLALDRARVRRCTSPAAPSMHGSRLTRRGRLVVAIAWAVLVALAVLPIVQHADSAADSNVPTVPVQVEAGETLWQVAQEVDPDADPRPLVDTIMELNGLRSGNDISPGDTLLVPASDG